MTIYRSEEEKQRLKDAYTVAVQQLGVEVEERYVETRHGRTHILSAGPTTGPPVVVFHGGNATNPMTVDWYSGLAEEHRLITPDSIGQPGYSAETRPDPQGEGYGERVVDVLDACDIRAAPMIGTSYGSGIVLRTAAVAPEYGDSIISQLRTVPRF